MRSTIEGARVQSAEMIGTKHFAKTQTLGAAYQVLDTDPDFLSLDANGAARNVDLPAATAANNGRMFLIYNPAAGAFSLTVRTFGGGSTVATVAQAKAAIVANFNGTWRALVGA